MMSRRAGWIGGAVAMVICGAAIYAWTASIDAEVGALPPPWSALLFAVLLAAPIAAAIGLLAAYIAGAARGRDGAERLLALTTSGLADSRDDWGRAMRAELASIQNADERRAFARSASATALFGWRAAEWIVAASVAAALIAIALVMSRLVIGVEPDGGLLLGTIIRALVLGGAALVVARTARSFRSGLEVGLLAWALTAVGLAVVRVIAATVWAQDHGLDTAATVFDALSPVTVWVHFVGLVPWVVLGAAVGARFAARGQQKGHPKAA